MRVGTTMVIWTCLAWAWPAYADCSDPPQPDVDWRRCTMHSRAFIDADLTGAKLKDGRFTRADFSGTDLSEVDGRRAKFIDAVARGAKFNGARLTGADFTKADLSDASFKDADLYRAQMQGAVLRGADLTGAQIDGADLFRADLSGARWVDGKTICAENSIGQCKLGAAPKAEGSSLRDRPNPASRASLAGRPVRCGTWGSTASSGTRPCGGREDPSGAPYASLGRVKE